MKFSDENFPEIRPAANGVGRQELQPGTNVLSQADSEIQDDELVVVRPFGSACEPVIFQPYGGVRLPGAFRNVCRRAETLREERPADRPGEGVRSRRVRARAPVVVDVRVAGASPSIEWRALRVRCVCPCIFCMGGRMVNVSMMPRLLSALDHAARVVVGPDTTMDRQPRWERRRRRRRDRRTARVGLRAGGARCTSDGSRLRRLALPAGHEVAVCRRCREELIACWMAASSTRFITWRWRSF